MKKLNSLKAAVIALALVISSSSAQSAFSKEDNTKKGDINGNGITDWFDTSLLQGWILAKPDTSLANKNNADYNGDKEINIFDLMRMNNELNSTGKSVTYNGSDHGEGWELENGVLSVSNSNGKTITDEGWKKYKDRIWSLKIEEGVTKTEKYAFTDLTYLKQITFPSTIKNIAEGTFKGCSDLLSVTFPDGLEEIEPYAFSGCESLGIVCMPDSILKISDKAFYGSDSIKIFGESDFVKTYCEKQGIDYVPYIIENIKGDTVVNYTDFSQWKAKIWGDDNGTVSSDGHSLALTAEDSYITAFCDDIIDRTYAGNKASIIVEAESTDKELLDHLYCGYVIPDPFNDLNYPKGEIISCSFENGIYKAKIKADITLDYQDSCYCQLRLGRNTDSVTGTVKITSFTMYSSAFEEYNEFDSSKWHEKIWGDDNGSVTFEDGNMIVSANDSYITAYASKLNSYKGHDFILYDTKMVVEADNKEIFNHIYLGNVSVNDGKENDLNYQKAEVLSVEQKGDVYEAVVSSSCNLFEEKFFTQMRLGENSDHVTGTIKVKSLSCSYDTDYSRVIIGDEDDKYGITQIMKTDIPEKSFSLYDPTDRSYVISALGMMYRFRIGLEETAGRIEDVADRRYIKLRKDNNTAYMSKYSIGTTVKAIVNEYCLDASTSYIDRIRNQSPGFGEYHEMSHSYVSKNTDKNFVHNADDSAVNFRNFISREINSISGKLPICDDNGKLIYDDLIYNNSKDNKNYFICTNTNTMDTYYEFKDDVCKGYIHDLSYDAYMKIYRLFEQEHKGKGRYVFSEFFSGAENIGYLKEDKENQNEISLALKNVLTPNFEKYQSYDDFMSNPQTFLHCINCLVKESNFYDKKINSQSEQPNMSEFLASHKDIEAAVRKMLYCAQVDHMNDNGSCDCLYKFMNREDFHVFCKDKNFDGKVDENDIIELEYKERL